MNKCGTIIQGKGCPFLNDVHYFIHKTNWALFKLIRVGFNALARVCNFFTHSFKTFMKFPKIVDLLNIEGNKFLKKIKKGGFSCFSSQMGICKILFFIARMHFANANNELALRNLNALCDIDIIYGLPCLILFTCWLKFH